MGAPSAVLCQMRQDPASGNYEVNMVVHLGIVAYESYLNLIWDDPHLSYAVLLPGRALCFISQPVYISREAAAAALLSKVAFLRFECNKHYAALVVYGSDQPQNFGPDKFVENYPELAHAVWRKPDN